MGDLILLPRDRDRPEKTNPSHRRTGGEEGSQSVHIFVSILCVLALSASSMRARSAARPSARSPRSPTEAAARTNYYSPLYIGSPPAGSERDNNGRKSGLARR